MHSSNSNNNHSNLPTSGALLWLYQQNDLLSPSSSTSTLEQSEIYHFAHQLLCQNSPRSASLLKAHSHPDLFILKPEEDSKWIKIDQVRELIDWSQGKPQIATRKIAIIVPADALNLQAANALLKTLEESPDQLLYILITDRPTALPATVISRCHTVRPKNKNLRPEIEIKDPIFQQVQRDLKQLSLNQTDPVVIAEQWIKQDLKQILYWLLVILNNRVRQAALSRKLPTLQPTFNFIDIVYQAKRTLQDSPSVNHQLLIEHLLIHFAEK